MKDNSLIKSIAAVFTSRALGSVMGMIGAVLIARWVDPIDMGLWNTASIILVFIPFADLGISYGLNRQLAYYLGNKDYKKVDSIAGTALTWSVSLFTFFIVITMLLALVGVFFIHNKMLITWCVVGIVSALTLLASYYTNTYRSSIHFIKLSKIELSLSVIGFVLILIVWAISYAGLLCRYAVLAVLSFLLLWRGAPIHVKWHWSKGDYKELLFIGIPLLITSQIEGAFSTLDRFVLVGSLELIGLFTVVLIIKAGIANLIGSVSQVMFASLSQKFGQTNSPQALWEIVRSGVTVAMLGSLILGLIGWFLVPYIIPVILPKYSSGIRAAQWSCFLSLAAAPSVAGNALKVAKQYTLLIIILMCIPLAFFPSYYVLSRDVQGTEQLVSVVQASLISWGIASLLMLLFTRRYCLIKRLVAEI